MKHTYQRELDEFRGRYEEIKVKIALDINAKTLHLIRERYLQYLESFKVEKQVIADTEVDSIELLFYICQRQHVDKSWLIDKLAEVEHERARLLKERELRACAMDDVRQVIRCSGQVIEAYRQSRGDLLQILDS
jgi:hypothetical protein